MKKNMSRLLLLSQSVGALAFLAGATTVADAQQVAAAAIGEDQAITVTARRRGERASDVPLSLSVLGGQSLSTLTQLKNANDVVQLVPNAQAAPNQGPARARWFIRGVGTNNTANNTINPIGIYYDDVYIANVGNQGWPLFDLERVEVLNGPQGTLWGKNSNGGAINYVSRAPTFETTGFAEISLGSEAEKTVEGAVSGPLIGDQVAGRLAYYYTDGGNWQKNLLGGGELGGGSDVAARGQLLYRPTDSFNIQANLHTRTSRYRNLGANYRPSTVSPAQTSTAAQRAYFSVFPTGPNTSTAYDETYVANDPPQELDASGGNVRATWDFGFATLTSITAYEQNLLGTNNAGAPLPLNSPYYNDGKPYSLSSERTYSSQWTEEVRLASPGEGRFTWLAGLYGFTGKQTSRSVAANYIRGAATGAGAATANAWGSGPQFSDTKYVQDTVNYAAFGSASYSLTDRLKISGGVRWSNEDNSIDWAYEAANIAGTAASFITNLPTIGFTAYAPRDLVFVDSKKQSTGSWTYDITPEFIFDDNVRSYFRYAHGVLPGGFTTTGLVPIPGSTVRANQIYTLNPEEIDAYEGGLKTQWFDRRAWLDLAAFFYDYKNLVVNVPTVLDPANPSVSTVIFRNAGAGEIKGVELRGGASPFEGFTVNGALGWLDSEYTKDTGVTATILGAQAPRSPKFTASLNAQYRHVLPNGGAITIGADARRNSKTFFYPTVSSQITNPEPLLWQDPYTLVNGRIGYDFTQDGRLGVQLSVLNLTDTEYKIQGLPVSNGTSNQRYGRPRSYLATINYKF